MKKFLSMLWNYFCYCGIEKEEYRKIKKQAYISNFNVWKHLHIMLCVIFTVVSISSYVFSGFDTYFIFSVCVAAYCLVIWALFSKILAEDSLLAQFIIYITMIVLFCFAMYSGLLHADMRTVTFEILLVMFSMFMIDKPYFMAILLSLSSAVYIIHVYFVKTGRPMTSDISNTALYCVLGIAINIFYNAIRVKEFVSTSELKKQRDCDVVTGLLNKAALIKRVNRQLSQSDYPGTMVLIDIDSFKELNLKYGHSLGDRVLTELGAAISEIFPEDSIKGRFAGDVFAVFIPGEESRKTATECADKLIRYTNGRIHTSNYDEIVGLSIGIAETAANEFDYDTLFKKADIALYDAKADGKNKYVVYED